MEWRLISWNIFCFIMVASSEPVASVRFERTQCNIYVNVEGHIQVPSNPIAITDMTGHTAVKSNKRQSRRTFRTQPSFLYLFVVSRIPRVFTRIYFNFSNCLLVKLKSCSQCYSITRVKTGSLIKYAMADDEFDGEDAGAEYDDIAEDDDNIEETEEQEEEGFNTQCLAPGQAGGGVEKSKRITTRYMTKYERARVLGEVSGCGLGNT